MRRQALTNSGVARIYVNCIQAPRRPPLIFGFDVFKALDRTAPVTELIAKKIIELTKAGERDPARLRDLTIQGFPKVVHGRAAGCAVLSKRCPSGERAIARTTAARSSCPLVQEIERDLDHRAPMPTHQIARHALADGAHRGDQIWIAIADHRTNWPRAVERPWTTAIG
jgi:hypothetical protein